MLWYGCLLLGALGSLVASTFILVHCRAGISCPSVDSVRKFFVLTDAKDSTFDTKCIHFGTQCAASCSVHIIVLLFGGVVHYTYSRMMSTLCWIVQELSVLSAKYPVCTYVVNCIYMYMEVEDHLCSLATLATTPINMSVLFAGH